MAAATTVRASTRAPVITSFALNPIPTNYRPAADCSGVYISGGVFMMDDKRSCLPERFNQAETAFYSPGVLCPTGYTAPAGCSRSDPARGSGTTVTCCPVRREIALSCVADPGTLEGVFSTLFCTWQAGPQTVLLATTTASGGVVQTTAVTMAGGEGINAYGVRMIYQASDLAALPVTTSGSSITGIGGAQTSGPATGPTATPEPPQGTTTGTTIALAVAIPLAVLALAGALFIFWRRRRRHRQVTELDVGPPQSYGQTNDYYKAESQTPQNGGYAPASELSTPAPQGGYYASKPSTVPVELDNGHQPTELPAVGYRR